MSLRPIKRDLDLSDLIQIVPPDLEQTGHLQNEAFKKKKSLSRIEHFGQVPGDLIQIAQPDPERIGLLIPIVQSGLIQTVQQDLELIDLMIKIAQ